MMTVLGYTNAPKTEVGALFPHRSTHCLQNRVLTLLKRLLSLHSFAPRNLLELTIYPVGWTGRSVKTIESK